MMRLEGATAHLKGGGSAPLHRVGTGWEARILDAPPGVYAAGEIALPSGTRVPFVLAWVVVLAEVSRITLYFSDIDPVGAEITRQMVALAA